MPEEEMCCGAGAGYNLSHPEFSDKILSRKMDNILISGAVEVATDCPGCIMQLDKGFQKRRKKVDILHTVEVLARSMGFD
jgi:Fe-S oxidoreductase